MPIFKITKVYLVEGATKAEAKAKLGAARRQDEEVNYLDYESIREETDKAPSAKAGWRADSKRMVTELVTGRAS